MNLPYDDVFSMFLSKITDYSFLEFDEEIIKKQMLSWLYSSLSNPRLRAKFSILELNDENDNLKFSLKIPIDESSDRRFVIELLSKGMVISWLEPQVKNVLLTKQLFGGKEEKFYAQANHLSQLQQLLKNVKIEFNNLLRDYGYLNNSYIKE